MSPADSLSQDAILAEIMSLVDPLPFDSSKDVFGDLAWCLVEQQIPYRARGIWMKKVFFLLDGLPLTPEAVQTLVLADWSQQKLAAPKYKNLMALAQSWQDEGMAGWDWDEMSDEAIIARLTAIKGIGEQTARQVLLFTLGRPNVFLPDDYQLKKAMRRFYDLADDKGLRQAMLNIADAWQPHASLGVRYLLAAGKIKR